MKRKTIIFPNNKKEAIAASFLLLTDLPAYFNATAR